ncbi:hypothetical protein BASA60_010642 [Batrachochytrium salamandrivorans]|nr:hypothetical protein BASA60_010642 [Batrachochytrium salamandrivorans]
MTDLATTQTGSPDRKRSLDRDSISDAGSVVERSSRYKRQATDDHGSTTELSAISLAISDDEEVTPLHYAEDDARAGASKPAPGGNTGGTGSASGATHAHNGYNQSGHAYSGQTQYGGNTFNQSQNTFHAHNSGTGHGVDPVQTGRAAGPMDPNAEPREPKPIRMRALISPKEAGVVIGKSGSHVAEIREMTGARVTVSGQVPGAYDRVVTVLVPNPPDPQARVVTLRLLVPQSRIGYIIGRQGVRIKELQETSGCRILAQGDPLPNSSERIVTVIGTPVCLETATLRIGLLIGEAADKQTGTVLYSPQAIATAAAYNMVNMGGMAYGGMAHGGQGMGGHPGMQHAAAAAQHRSMGYSNMAAAYGSQGGQASMQAGQGGVAHPGYYGAMQGMTHQHVASQMAAYGYQQAYGGSNSMQMMAAGYGGGSGGGGDGSSKVEQITIPDECVGAIIGKGGSKVNEVRVASGCQIKIGDPQPGLRRRIITLTGSAEAVSKAQFMLLARVEHESQNKERR